MAVSLRAKTLTLQRPTSPLGELYSNMGSVSFLITLPSFFQVGFSDGFNAWNLLNNNYTVADSLSTGTNTDHLSSGVWLYRVDQAEVDAYDLTPEMDLPDVVTPCQGACLAYVVHWFVSTQKGVTGRYVYGSRLVGPWGGLYIQVSLYMTLPPFHTLGIVVVLGLIFRNRLNLKVAAPPWHHRFHDFFILYDP